MKGKETITGRVRNISSIAHRTVFNGKPCDLYTAFVKICQTGYIGSGLCSWYLVVTGKTESDVEAQLEKYRTEEPIIVSTKDLIDKGGNPYGKARN